MKLFNITLSRRDLFMYSFLILIILIGFYLRFSAISNNPLWMDEGESAIDSVNFIKNGHLSGNYQGQNISYGAFDYENGGSKYTLSPSNPENQAVHGWLNFFPPGILYSVFGKNATIMRLPNLFYFLLTAIFLLLISFSLFKSKFIGVLSVLIYSTFNKVVFFEYQLRYYSLSILLCMILTWLILNRRDQVYLQGAFLILLYHTHLLIFLAMFVVWFIFSIINDIIENKHYKLISFIGFQSLVFCIFTRFNILLSTDIYYFASNKVRLFLLIIFIIIHLILILLPICLLLKKCSCKNLKLPKDFSFLFRILVYIIYISFIIFIQLRGDTIFSIAEKSILLFALLILMILDIKKNYNKKVFFIVFISFLLIFIPFILKQHVRNSLPGIILSFLLISISLNYLLRNKTSKYLVFSLILIFFVIAVVPESLSIKNSYGNTYFNSLIPMLNEERFYGYDIFVEYNHFPLMFYSPGPFYSYIWNINVSYLNNTNNTYFILLEPKKDSYCSFFLKNNPTYYKKCSINPRYYLEDLPNNCQIIAKDQYTLIGCNIEDIEFWNKSSFNYCSNSYFMNKSSESIACLNRIMSSEERIEKFTEPMNSYKIDQLYGAHRAYILNDFIDNNVSSVLLNNTEELYSWINKVYLRIMTPEWSDIYYSLSIGKVSSGPYINQENGLGAVSIICSFFKKIGKDDSKCSKYISKNSNGWATTSRNTDDSIGYQQLWIYNAWYQSNYAKYNFDNLNESFYWIFNQWPASGEKFGYNPTPDEIPLDTLLLGYHLTKNPDFLYLADKVSRQMHEDDLAAIYGFRPGLQYYSLLENLNKSENNSLLHSKILYGPSGNYINNKSVQVDKMIIRGGQNESIFGVFNLRYSGYHSYPATNALIALHINEKPVVAENLRYYIDPLLPKGRQQERDERISRSRLNGFYVNQSKLKNAFEKFNIFKLNIFKTYPIFSNIDYYNFSDSQDIAIISASKSNQYKNIRLIYREGGEFILILDSNYLNYKIENGVSWHFLDNSSQPSFSYDNLTQIHFSDIQNNDLPISKDLAITNSIYFNSESNRSDVSAIFSTDNKDKYYVSKYFYSEGLKCLQISNSKQEIYFILNNNQVNAECFNKKIEPSSIILEKNNTIYKFFMNDTFSNI